MSSSPDIMRFKSDHLQQAEKTLGRAFFDNPMSKYLLPDADQRRRHLGWMLGTSTLYSDLFGEVYTTPDVQGIAAWLTPDSPPLNRERAALANMDQTPERIGAGAYARLRSMQARAAELHLRDVPERHWYLWVLGVEPERQGQGIGGLLLQPVLHKADAGGLLCYLETDKPSSIKFYRKHGFEVVVEESVDGGAFRFWTMKRPPQTNAVSSLPAEG
jgi:ribosomal protein S18 acetylase RimI-like enzyme